MSSPRQQSPPSANAEPQPAAISAEMLQDVLSEVFQAVATSWLPAAKVETKKPSKNPDTISGEMLIVANLDGKIPGTIVLKGPINSLRRVGLALGRSKQADAYIDKSTKSNSADPQAVVFGFTKCIAETLALRFDSRGSYQALLPTIYSGQGLCIPWPYKRGAGQSVVFNGVELDLYLGIKPPAQQVTTGGERRSIIGKLKAQIQGAA